jgi:hypothetical protein
MGHRPPLRIGVALVGGPFAADGRPHQAGVIVELASQLLVPCRRLPLQTYVAAQPALCLLGHIHLQTQSRKLLSKGCSLAEECGFGSTNPFDGPLLHVMLEDAGQLACHIKATP